MKRKLSAAVILSAVLISAVPVHAHSDVSRHLEKMDTSFTASETPSKYLKGITADSRKFRLWLNVRKYRCQTKIYSDGSTENRYTVTYRMSRTQAAVSLKAEKAIAKKGRKKGLRYIYDSTRKIRYHSGSNLDYTPYGALVRKKASCEGTSLAFSDICYLAGYKTKVVCGKGWKGGAHMWTAVKVKGKWKYFDPTWDIGKKAPKYYMKSAAYMKKTGHIG